MPALPRSGLKWLEAGLFIVGFVLILGQAARMAAGSQDVSLVGWGFAVAGFGLLLPRAIAGFCWPLVWATVLEVTDDPKGEVPTLTFAYAFAKRQISGTTSESSSLRVGDNVPVRVNPSDPEVFFAMTATPILLGFGFVAVGVATGMSGATL